MGVYVMNYKLYLSWILVIIWMVVIYSFSAQSANESELLSSGITDWTIQLLNRVLPNLNIETLHLIIRQLAHLIIFLILGVLLLNALNQSDSNERVNFVLALLISLIYAISDEIHQIYVPGRVGQIYDVLVDFLGSLIGIKIFIIYNNFKKNRE